MYNSFKPGQVWKDTNGKPIQAHGFSVFYNAKDKTWYWYGENKEKTKKYVAWLKIMADEVSQFMSVMQADDFLGPYEFVHKVYKPLDMDTGDFALHVDEETKKACPLPGKEQKHRENTSKSTYVWLPIEWQGEKPVIRWRDEWKLEDF